jgi:hypothetical protein
MQKEILLLLFVAAPVMVPPSTMAYAIGTTTTNAQCDSSLWQYENKTEVTQVISVCVTVSGTILNILRADEAQDEQVNIRLKLDPQYSNYSGSKLNDIFLTILPEQECFERFNQNTQNVDSLYCSDPKLRDMKIGNHVVVSGSYVVVNDTEGGQTAKMKLIMPVTSINMVPALVSPDVIPTLLIVGGCIGAATVVITTLVKRHSKILSGTDKSEAAER